MIQTPKAKSNQSFSVTPTINSYPATSTATSTGTWNARSTLTSKTNHKINVVYLIVFVVGLIWGLVLWETHYALLTWHPSSSGEIGPQVLSRISLQQETWKDNADLTLVSHIGWQPHIHTENACSWRECFKPEHNCPKCRDLLEDMEQVPDPPSNWVPDVTMLHRMRIQGKDAQGRPWPPPLDAELCQPIGNFGGKQDDNKALLDKVPLSIPSPNTGNTTPKVLCMIYTMKEQHATNIRAMRETWASYCDGFLAFSTANDPRLPAISLPHDGPEEYNNMWQKVRSIWKFVGTHYLEDFDFFFQGGEDLFVIPQNLKHYLQTLLDHDGKTSDDDYFVGRRFKGYGNNNYFNSGGAGYALSRGTLRKFIHDGWNHPQCSPNHKTAMEDVMIAQCLRVVFGIGLTDTRDFKGRERFHPFAPATHLYWRPPREGQKDWYKDYNEEWPPLLDEMCCAPDSVSFHYIKKPAMVRHLFALLNGCDGGHGND